MLDFGEVTFSGIECLVLVRFLEQLLALGNILVGDGKFAGIDDINEALTPAPFHLDFVRVP